MIPSDDTLENISHQLDEFLFELCEENEMPFLQIAALTLARLGAIATDISETEQLIRLLKLTEITINGRQTAFHAESGGQIH